ncbi:MAG: hypothetical protein R2762_29800 [Bryobacteraceae bacterium]
MATTRRAFLTHTAFAAAAAQSAPAPDWGGPVLDIHLHPRREPDGEFVHMQGCGVTHAVILGRVTGQDETQARMKQHPGRMRFFASTDVAAKSGESPTSLLRQAARKGATGFGELKSHGRRRP